MPPSQPKSYLAPRERHKPELGKGLQPFAIVMGKGTAHPARKSLTLRAERAALEWRPDCTHSPLSSLTPCSLPEFACFEFRTDYRFSSEGHFTIANCCRLD